MQRLLEPEIMDGPEQSLAYAGADFSTSNQLFVNHLVAEGSDLAGRLIDIGCGPCDVMVRLSRALPNVSITAIDGSEPMIDLARRAIQEAGLEGRIAVMLGRIPGLALPEHSFDVILSKDLLHHLPEPMVLWHEARRLGRAGAAVHVMDLIRPPTEHGAREIVERVASKEPPVLKEDFYNSLRAAFTIDEIKAQLEEVGLPFQVEQVSDRHMLIEGALP